MTDSSAEQGLIASENLALRGDHRTRRALRSAIGSGGARVVDIAAGMVAAGLLVRLLGTEQFGVIASLTSIAASVAFLDLGVGNSVINLVASANAGGNSERVQETISTAAAVLLAASVGVAVIVLIAVIAVPWDELLGFREVSRGVLAATASGVLLCASVAIPLGLPQKVLIGFQRGDLASLIGLAGSGVSLVFILVAAQMDLGLPKLALLQALGPLCAMLIGGLVLVRRRPGLAPIRRAVTQLAARRILGLGTMYFALQIAVAIAYQSDVIVSAHFVGAEAAATYALTLRLFSLGSFAAGLITYQLWPAYADALARRDHDWVRRALGRSILVSIGLSGVPALLVVLFARDLLRAWTGSDVAVPAPFLVGMAIWTVVASAFNAVSMLLNAAEAVRFQIAVALPMAVASVAFSIIGAQTFGLSGVIWGTLVAYLCFAALPIVLYLPRFLRQMSQFQDQ